MTRPRADRKPTFFWQAVLIVLPVAALAALGLVSLRQDRLLAEQEAREQAQAIAWTLAHECGTRLNRDIEEFAQASRRQEQTSGLTAGTLRPEPGQDAAEEIRSGRAIADRWQGANPEGERSTLPQARCLIRDGVLIDPPDYSPVPQPPEWFVNLLAQWAEQWKEADAALNQRRDAATARSILENLVRARQPSEDPLRVNAKLKLLLIDQGATGATDRFRKFRDLMSKHASVPTETGIPLGGIVCHHAIRLAPSGPAFDAVLDDFVFCMQNAPSILTGKLLDEVESRAKAEDSRAQERVRAIRYVWAAREGARNLLRPALREKLTNPGILELTSKSGRFLAFWSSSLSVTTNSALSATNAPATVNGEILLVPSPVIDRAVQKATREGKVRPPDYAVVRLNLH